MEKGLSRITRERTYVKKANHINYPTPSRTGAGSRAAKDWQNLKKPGVAETGTTRAVLRTHGRTVSWNPGSLRYARDDGEQDRGPAFAGREYHRLDRRRRMWAARRLALHDFVARRICNAMDASGCRPNGRQVGRRRPIAPAPPTAPALAFCSISPDVVSSAGWAPPILLWASAPMMSAMTTLTPEIAQQSGEN
jgi:hypothetical protein